jgi:hypothetical protein
MRASASERFLNPGRLLATDLPATNSQPIGPLTVTPKSPD